jgi:transposase
MRIAPAITLTEEQGERVQSCARSRSLPRRLVERAEMILLDSEGRQNKAIALTLRRGRSVVARLRQRFIESGLAGIEKDAPRPGRRPKLSPARAQEIVRKTKQKTPPHAAHWSTRSMTRAAGVSEATARRIWRAYGLKPHGVRSLKLSREP